MTMPHLMNCPHSPDGWCLDCVKEMGEQLIDLRHAILSVSNLSLESTYASGQDLVTDTPDRIEIKKTELSKWKRAMREVSVVCKKYLI